MRIFLHGLESSSRGTKASFLRTLFPEMVVPDFEGGLSERLRLLNDILAGHRGVTLVGSSFGGLMATIYVMENPGIVDRLVLLAPALNFPEFSRYEVRPVDSPAWMIIGRHDTVTPASDVFPVAGRIFTDLKYEEVDDDHLLAATFRGLDWTAMLTG